MARQPYERQTDESDKAFEAFALYRDLGTNRTTDAVARQLSKSLALIQRWSAQYAWVERVAVYDAYIDAQARKQLERDAIKRKADMLKRHALLGKVLQQKSAAYLDKHGIDRSSDAIAAARVGVDMERKAEGLPEYLMEVMNADDSELARQYAELLAQVSHSGSGDAEAGDAPAGTDAAETAPETNDGTAAGCDPLD